MQSNVFGALMGFIAKCTYLVCRVREPELVQKLNLNSLAVEIVYRNQIRAIGQ